MDFSLSPGVLQVGLGRLGVKVVAASFA
jgi:hypothetical protein